MLKVVTKLILRAIQSSTTFAPVHVSSTQEMPPGALLLVVSGILLLSIVTAQWSPAQSQRSSSSDASISVSLLREVKDGSSFSLR